MAGLEAQVAVRDNAHQLVALGDRHAGNMVRARQRQHLANGGVGRGGDGITDDAAFVLLDLADFLGLALGREVLVDNAETPFLRHGDAHARLGHRVHGGRNQRNIQRDAAGQGGFQLDIPG